MHVTYNLIYLILTLEETLALPVNRPFKMPLNEHRIKCHSCVAIKQTFELFLKERVVQG